MARPTVYDPKFCEMLLKHFSVKPYRKLKRKLEANDFPTLAGFAIKIGVHRETLLEWAKAHEEFSDAYKMAKEYQENFLVINGLKGLINTNFGIFTAVNVLGFRNKPKDEVDVVVNNIGQKSDEELDKRIQELMAKQGQGETKE